jgi:hypothetical protein
VTGVDQLVSVSDSESLIEEENTVQKMPSGKKHKNAKVQKIRKCLSGKKYENA